MSAHYEYDPEKTVVIQHPVHGIFIGEFMGLGFWSKVDPAGQDCAPTFPTEEVAREHVASWKAVGFPIEELQYPKVKPDIDCGYCDKLHYATIDAIAAAGLEPWNPCTHEEMH